MVHSPSGEGIEIATSLHRASRSCLDSSAVRWAVAALILTTPAAFGIDLTVDWRDTEQTGRTLERTFTTHWQRESITVRQPVRLFESDLRLDLGFRASRETAGGDASGVNLESERESWRPDATLSWQIRGLNIGLKGNYSERTATGATGLSPETTAYQYGGWANAQLSDRTRLSSSIDHTASEDRDAFALVTENRQTSGFLTFEHGINEDWRFDYRFAGLDSDLVTRNASRRQYSNGFQLRGAQSHFNDRLDATFRMHSQFFTQKRQSGGGETTSLRIPLSSGVLLDDTPEIHDPLEEEVQIASGLSDGDRETSTSIDIGDDAPAVREFGGDYRNLRLDFGNSEEFRSALLFVDDRLVTPEFFEWRVFVTDDPEGREWHELGPGDVQISWREWAELLNGWEFEFARGVSGRWLKFVDVKRGVTIPHLSPTELEVYVAESEELVQREENSQDHDAAVSLGYDLTPRVRIGAQSMVGRRTFEDPQRNLIEMSHGLYSNWTGDKYRLGGRVTSHRITSRARRNTNVNTWQLNAARLRTRTFDSIASWTLTDDNSGDFDRQTQSWALVSNWRTAPRLRIRQRLSHGRRRDRQLDDRSKSWSMSHAIRAAPYPYLRVDLDRTDRWVDREVGSGFRNFSDTGAGFTWNPLPLVSLSADAKIHVQEQSSWTSRQGIVWSPLPDGVLELRFSSNGYYDSRERIWRVGGGVASEWRPRAGLLIEGSINAQRYRVEGVMNSPVSTQVHVSWTL